LGRRVHARFHNLDLLTVQHDSFGRPGAFTPPGFLLAIGQ